MAEMIADRFVRDAQGSWRDMATGAPVRVDIGPIDADWGSRAARLDDEIVSGSTGLIDYGGLGTTQSFEARLPSDTTCRLLPEHVAAAGRAAKGVLALATASYACGARLTRVAAPNAWATACEIARRSRELGFVAVRPAVAPSQDCWQELEHRHLALLILDDDDARHAEFHLRRIARLSARAHLVIDLRQPRRPPDAVHERGPEWDAGVQPLPPTTPELIRLARGRRSHARRRSGDAERWYQSALESARRHGNETAEAAACRALIDLRTRRDAWAEAESLALSRLRHLHDPSACCAVNAALAGVLLARGEVSRAEAILSTELAIAELSNATWSSLLAEVRLRKAEVHFWQGRAEEAETLLSEAPLSAEALAWRGLTAWARADPNVLGRCRDALMTKPEGGVEQTFWGSALATLAGGGSEADVATFMATARATGRPSLIRLSRAIGAEALDAAGRRTSALRALGSTAAWAGAPARDVLLFEWMRARLAGDSGQSVTRSLHRTGLAGIRRWGFGSQDMHLVHAIPEVLELVHDAEDEMTALKGACEWARREGGADAAAIMTADHVVVAGCNWTTTETLAILQDGPALSADGPLTVSSDVRYGGVSIGSVAVRGTADRRRTLEEASRIVAALCAPALRSRLDALRASRESQNAAPEILGRSAAIVALKETMSRAAATPFAVLIEGESGTGKELVARAIHRLSPRRDRRFSAVNCAALTDELVEAELFGHARGAFTGAIGPRAGLFEDAHAGTLFLDEVAELSPRAQAKLLRVLQEHEVRRLGENAPRPIDVRVIAATNQPLTEAVRRGVFREDLLFRLAVVRFRLPPLRDRLEDLPVLADACWRALSREAGKRATLMPDALAALSRHGWPGNVREFQNVMAALAVIAPDRGRVGARHVAQVLDASIAHVDEDVVPLDRLRARCERRAVTGALARHNGRKAAAARDLGLTRQGLAKIIKRLGLAGARDATGAA